MLHGVCVCVYVCVFMCMCTCACTIWMSVFNYVHVYMCLHKTSLRLTVHKVRSVQSNIKHNVNQFTAVYALVMYMRGYYRGL